MALYKVTKKQSGGGSNLVLKKYAYIPGAGIAVYFRDRTTTHGHNGILKPILNREMIGELQLKFYESSFNNNRFLLTSGSRGPSIKHYNVSGTGQCFRIYYKADSSSNSYVEDIQYSTGEHEILFNRFSDHKIIFDGTALNNDFDPGSSGSEYIYLFGSSTSSSSNSWIGYFEEITLRDITDNSDIVHIVPAEFDGTACLYDTINKDFYYYWNMTVMDTIPTS